jgi:hypothetical protein
MDLLSWSKRPPEDVTSRLRLRLSQRKLRQKPMSQRLEQVMRLHGGRASRLKLKV